MGGQAEEPLAPGWGSRPVRRGRAGVWSDRLPGVAPGDVALLAFLIVAAALLYSSVGHAGASAYLAAMALVGLAPEVMKPTALVLNILVAVIGTIRFSQAGAFSWATLWPFLLGSMPLAFVGGAVQLPGVLYKPLVGLVLLYAAVRLLWSTWARQGVSTEVVLAPPLLPAVVLGSGIGLLSGLIGVGGGIFLTPLLLFRRWAETRRAAGVSAAFILLNSLAGLAGNVASVRFLPGEIPVWAAAAGAGGLVGSGLGSRRLGTATLRRLLAVVLVIAGLKLILG
jgi:uncharacterized membrane protein YfcA